MEFLHSTLLNPSNACLVCDLHRYHIAHMHGTMVFAKALLGLGRCLMATQHALWKHVHKIITCPIRGLILKCVLLKTHICDYESRQKTNI